MSHSLINETSIRLETDTLVSVIPVTAHKQLVEIMKSESLENLIHLLLRNLAAETGVIPTGPT